MRALESIIGHMVYNLAYTQILQTTTTIEVYCGLGKLAAS